MSGMSIAYYFPFRRIKITHQSVAQDTKTARIDIGPDKRFLPVCSRCGRVSPRIHSHVQRQVRDLNLASFRVWLHCHYRKILCLHCRRIDKHFLEAQYGKIDTSGVRILAVDEIAIRKGHRYLTVVLDYERGRVIWVGKHRRAKTLSSFFNKMPKRDRKTLEAIAMDGSS